MPYYENRKLLFIHIPKTGGTVVENELKKKYKETLYSGETNKILNPPFNMYSLQHQFYTTIYRHKSLLNVNFEQIKIFSIVRNPYDRIISDLFFLRMIEKNYSADQVFEIIKNNYLYRTDLDNHNEPQYMFIINEKMELIPNIKIFKTEELNMINNELNKFIGTNINIKQKNINKNYSKYLNSSSIGLINEVYQKDFELFNYDLILS